MSARAIVTEITLRAPAFLSWRAHSLTVAPVVKMSSTTSTERPETSVPAAASYRSSMLMNRSLSPSLLCTPAPAPLVQHRAAGNSRFPREEPRYQLGLVEAPVAFLPRVHGDPRDDVGRDAPGGNRGGGEPAQDRVELPDPAEFQLPENAFHDAAVLGHGDVRVQVPVAAGAHGARVPGPGSGAYGAGRIHQGNGPGARRAEKIASCGYRAPAPGAPGREQDVYEGCYHAVPYRVGSGTPASRKPFFLITQLSQEPQASPSGEGS